MFGRAKAGGKDSLYREGLVWWSYGGILKVLLK
jgi:hypothetical protein